MNTHPAVKTCVTTFICISAFLLMTLSACYAGSEAQDKRWVNRSVGIRTGYGVSFNNDDKQVQMIGVFPNIKWGLQRWSIGEDKTFELGFSMEATLVQFVKPHGAIGAGFSPFIRGAFNLAHVTPYIQIGAGFIYTNLDVRDLGQEFNFNLQGEGGVEFALSDRLLFNIGYRYFHVSNAGLSSNNLGLDINMGVAGISYRF